MTYEHLANCDQGSCDTDQNLPRLKKKLNKNLAALKFSLSKVLPYQGVKASSVDELINELSQGKSIEQRLLDSEEKVSKLSSDTKLTRTSLIELKNALSETEKLPESEQYWRIVISSRYSETRKLEENINKKTNARKKVKNKEDEAQKLEKAFMDATEELKKLGILHEISATEKAVKNLEIHLQQEIADSDLDQNHEESGKRASITGETEETTEYGHA